MRISFEERLLLLVLGLTVTGAMLLISAGKGVEDGHQSWKPGSALHFITRLMNFDYAYPTPKGTSVKRLAAGVGSAAALVIAALMWARRHSPRAFVPPGRDAAWTAEVAPAPPPGRWYDMLSPAEGAQLAMLALVAWSFASTLWSVWPEVAVGESVLLAIGVIWAVCLGRALSRRAAMAGAVTLFVILVVTAALGIWYQHERNPVQRLKFPLGNPLFLAACMVPGVLIAAHVAVGSLLTVVRSGRMRHLGWFFVAVTGLVPLLWALRLTGARGAIAGVAAGLWMTLLLKLRGHWRWIAVAIAVVGLYSGYRYAQTRSAGFQGGRGATIRVRMYGAAYAWKQFLARPAGGHGQGGFVLAADSLSREDAENDPQAFVSERMVHAHNEWLETLADLGAVGIALVVVGYGVTFWACGHAHRERGAGVQEWCFLGLVASLAGLMVEEATDVALRMPGLPAVWYTVLGLVWAMTRSDEAPAHRARPFSRPVLWLGTGASFAIAITLFVCSLGDWTGALAEARVGLLLEQQRWQKAAQAAEAGSRGRLAADEIVDAAARRIHCHADIAEYHLRAIQALADAPPVRESDGTARAELQRQDIETMRTHTVAAHQETLQLLQRSPAYPYVAGRVGRLFLDVVQVETRLGGELTPDAAGRIQEEARALLLMEYHRNRFDTQAALQCVVACAAHPIDERVEWMCSAIRGFSVPGGPGEYRAVLAQLMEVPEFTPAAERRAQVAYESFKVNGPAMWRDPFAPEAMRLWAMICQLQRRGDNAVNAAAVAVELCRSVGNQYPMLLPMALAEQAEYAFRASPDSPEAACRIGREAIQAVPRIQGGELLAAVIRRSVILYHLANEQETEAFAMLKESIGPAEPADVQRQIGLAYTELSGQYILGEPGRRPKRFAVWMRRAGELAPDSRDLQFLRAELALEAGRDADAVAAFRKAEELGAPAEQLDQMLEQAVRSWPNSKMIAEYLEARRAAQRPATAPASAPAEIAPPPGRTAPAKIAPPPARMSPVPMPPAR